MCLKARIKKLFDLGQLAYKRSNILHAAKIAESVHMAIPRGSKKSNLRKTASARGLSIEQFGPAKQMNCKARCKESHGAGATFKVI